MIEITNWLLGNLTSLSQLQKLQYFKRSGEIITIYEHIRIWKEVVMVS
jgi:hypothetical protein